MTETVIACDESGSEGENLTAAAHPVFAHGSVHLTEDEAFTIVETVRTLTGTQAAEVKAKQLLVSGATSAREYLLGDNSPLLGKAKVVLVDKDYFIVAKIIDVLVEELTHANGIDLYANRRARDIALELHRSGERALKSELWNQLLGAFNSLTRATQRAGDKTTVEEFFALVDIARSKSWVKPVTSTLNLLYKARPYADEFQQRLVENPKELPTLDPLTAALPLSIHCWYEELRAPLTVIHDENATLSPDRVTTMLDVLRKPLPEFRRLAPPVRIDSLTQTNSKQDPRIQVADLIAGLARQVATSALNGDAPLPAGTPDLLRPFVVPESIWSENKSWEQLTGRNGVGR